MWSNTKTISEFMVSDDWRLHYDCFDPLENWMMTYDFWDNLRDRFDSKNFSVEPMGVYIKKNP